MKYFSLALFAAGLFAVSCTQFEQELDPSSDPLRSPYANLKKEAAGSQLRSSGSQSFRPGQSVETSMPDAEFYESYPVFRKKADRTLPVATAAEVLSYRGSYVKVRLEAGQTGYIPSIALIDRYDSSSSNLVEVASSSDVPVLDPLTEDEILRRIDEEEARLRGEQTLPTPDADDFIAPEPEVLGIGQPTEIKDDALPKVDPEPDFPRTTPNITIQKPSDTLPTAPIDAPAGDQIIQDAALE